MPKASFRSFIEQKLRKFPNFMIYCILEWFIIIFLFLAGILAFISDHFAELCELRIPCLLCARIDHVLVYRNPKFYYNNSICGVHKEDISSLAYCHVHRKLSDIRNMCEGCLLSFSSDVNRFVKKDGLEKTNEKSDIQTCCCCCGETLKVSSEYKHSLSMNASSPSSSPSPSSPRALLSATKCTETESELPEHQVAHAGGNKGDTTNAEATTVPLLLDYEDVNELASRTPSFARGNKFFGTPFSDSSQASPRWGNTSSRKLSINKVNFSMDPNDVSSLSSKSLMALYMELEEERSAAAVAANNAMAMITRLQAEKASVQMEALQYRRMMEEQAQYDQEAMQVMKDMLLRRDEDVKALESQLETYRENYGHISKKVGSEICEVDADQEDYHEMKSRSFSSFSEKSECCSFVGGVQDENERPYESSVEYGEDWSLDFEGERSFIWSLLSDVEKRIISQLDKGSSSPDNDADGLRGLTREVSLIRERLRAFEAESGFLKHAAVTLQRGGEGTKVLNEIAEHLHKLRSCFDNVAV